MYRDKDPGGSFVAWGIGFEYKYDASHQRLDVVDSKRTRTILSLEHCDHLNLLPINFVGSIDKVIQIQALVFSDHQTIDLQDVFEGRQLDSIIAKSVSLSTYSWDLRRGLYARFRQEFCHNSALKDLSICQHEASFNSTGFYTAHLQTTNNNHAKAQSEYLYETISRLSKITLRDITPREYAYNMHSNTTRSLIEACTNLYIISKAIDDSYTPLARTGNILKQSRYYENIRKIKNLV